MNRQQEKVLIAVLCGLVIAAVGGVAVQPTKSTARGMTFTAMAQRLDQLPPARDRLWQIAGQHIAVIRIKHLPQAQTPPNVERKPDLMCGTFLI